MQGHSHQWGENVWMTITAGRKDGEECYLFEKDGLLIISITKRVVERACPLFTDSVFSSYFNVEGCGGSG